MSLRLQHNKFIAALILTLYLFTMSANVCCSFACGCTDSPGNDNLHCCETKQANTQNYNDTCCCKQQFSTKIPDNTSCNSTLYNKCDCSAPQDDTIIINADSNNNISISKYIKYASAGSRQNFSLQAMSVDISDAALLTKCNSCLRISPPLLSFGTAPRAPSA